jgi:hypothetical protein
VQCLERERWLLIAPAKQQTTSGQAFDRRVLRPRSNWDRIASVEKPDRDCDCRVQVKA